MRASATMTREVIVIPPELPLQRAWDLMHSKRIRHLPVLQGGKLIGILSDRDIGMRGRLDEEGAFDVPDLPVGAAMTLMPVTCQTSTTVSEIASTMVDKKIDALPVVDAGGRLVGLVTSTDLLQLLIEKDTAQVLPFEFTLKTAEGAAVVAAA